MVVDEYAYMCYAGDAGKAAGTSLRFRIRFSFRTVVLFLVFIFFSYTRPVARQVRVMLYPTDTSSTVTVVAGGAAIARATCASRTAGPFNDRLRVTRYATVAECYAVPLGGQGTLTSVEVGVTGSSAVSTMVYRLTIRRDTDGETAPLVTGVWAANGTAGAAFAPGYITVDYDRWSDRYGNDTLYSDDAAAVVVALGNEYGTTSVAVSGDPAPLAMAARAPTWRNVALRVVYVRVRARTFTLGAVSGLRTCTARVLRFKESFGFKESLVKLVGSVESGTD
eukprot:1192597-Prorocentrum_minimum.AAC.5